MELQQQHGSGRCRLGERAGEGRGKERERVERAGELGSALKHGKKASWRTARALEATRQRSAARSAMNITVHQISKFQFHRENTS